MLMLFALFVFWKDYTMVVLIWNALKCSQRLVNENCLGRSLSNKLFVKHKAIGNIFHPVKYHV